MTHRLIIYLSIAVLLVAGLVAWPSVGPRASGEAAGFIISQADATNTLSITGSSELTTLIQNTLPRFVFQYANAKNIVPITSPPEAMLSLVQTVEERFVMQYANASNTLAITYPLELIGDTTPPAISEITTSVTGGSFSLVVETSEYTTAVLKIGTSPGNYTTTLGDDQYRTQHTFAPGGLQTGVSYYYRVIVTDRSGNTYQSPEATFTAISKVYLPVTIR